ncbi:condensation domain-containing protein [Streptomyces djakartensis]|uniref:Condensation domain-containing protein n=1 Tax=Streptomyces djakartensis TaxID=68193 RepID=A0ABQ2ZIP8_9ACTN|nr:condensation domain-containing protein [Streptomyces djakartensis]GGY15925.1 hypothetical protein GCM10010384_22320 [Streptomyces djakartensis]
MSFLEVRFDGCSDRFGGITWAQQDIYGFIYGSESQTAQEKPDLQDVLKFPGSLTPEACQDVLRELVTRQEALRTTFEQGEGEFLSQHVCGEGTMPVVTCRAAADQQERATAHLQETLTAEPIDVTSEFPVRFGLVIESERVRRIVVVISHMVVDGWGLENLLQDLHRLLSDPGSDGPAVPTFHQLDQWEWERSKHGVMRADAALSYRRQLLEHSGTNAKAAGAPSRPLRPMRRGGLSLDAGPALALARASQAMSMSSSAALLALCADAASEVLQRDRLIFNLHCGNRFRPALRDSVTRLKSMSLMPYERGTDSFENSANRVWKSLLVAHQHAQLPPGEAETILRRSGPHFLMGFNDRRPIADGVGGQLLGSADRTEYSDTSVTLVDSVAVSNSPHLEFAIDPNPGCAGLSVKLESNVLEDDEIIWALTRIEERIRRLPSAGPLSERTS